MTRFAKLSLLLIVAGAFALAGCGGDDNGLSAEDQARISTADKAAADAKAAADKAAADAKAAADKAAADKMAADAAIADAKAAADAAKEAADAAKAEADQAKQDAADAKMAADQANVTAGLEAAWEGIAGSAIEADLAMQITKMAGSATGPVSHMQLVDAIKATAMKYGLDATDALTALEGANPTHAVLRRTAVDALVAGLHEANELAATRASVEAVLTGPQGDPGDTAPDTVLANAWEKIAGEAIADDLEAQINRLSGSKTGPVSHKNLSDAIKATAKKFGIDATAALATLDAENPTFSRLQRSAADMVAKTIHDGDDLAATEKSATYVIAMQAATTVDSLPGGIARSAAGKVAMAAKAVAKMIETDLTGDRLTDGHVWDRVEAIVQMYTGTLTNAEVGPIVNAAVTAARNEVANPAVGTAATAKSIAAAVQTALTTAYSKVADADDLPQVDADGMLVADGTMPDDDDVIDGSDLATADVSDEAHPQAVLDHPNTEGNTASFLSADPDDYDMADLLSDIDPEEASYGDEIYTFSSLIDKGGFGDSDVNAMVYGAWMRYSVFGVATAVGGVDSIDDISAFAFGPTADAPTGKADGSASWDGIFRGVHVQNNSTHATATNVTAMAGEMVDGRVTLSVDFDADGTTDTLDITFDRFKVGEMDSEHEIMGAVLNSRGGFDKDTLEDALADVDGSMVMGQFYGPDKDTPMAAGGVMELVSGMVYQMGTDDDPDSFTAPAADEVSEAYHIKGAFGAE